MTQPPALPKWMEERPSTDRERIAYGAISRARKTALAAAAAKVQARAPYRDEPYELEPGDEPVSSCAACHADGYLNVEQVDDTGHRLVGLTRFSCPCGASWLVDTREAAEHGAWLRKAGLRRPLPACGDVGKVSVPPESC